MSQPIISIEAELPQSLYDAVTQYLDERPDWDRDRVMTTAVAMFLLQSGNDDRVISRTYLDGLFGRVA